MAKKKKNKITKKVIIILFLSICTIGGWKVYSMYQHIYKSNVILKEKETTYLYISTGSTLNDVAQLLYEKNYIINRTSFEWLAEKKNYKNHIHPGRYLIKNQMNNNDLINLLRSGKQVPINIVFNNIRTLEELAGKISMQIEADSTEIINLLNNNNFISKYGFNQETIISTFIPNTYEFFWSTSAEVFFTRMAKEYKKFWNNDRKNKAKSLNLTQSEVSTLASIVEEETFRKDEETTVAGLYINRIKKNIRLQADPTVKYAIGDFTIRRVLTRHTKFDSPYNTYKYKGLPPGPICIPSISAIDAVLNYKTHKYIYMCAKGDGTYGHHFSKTLREHNLYAKKYQAHLNRQRIYR